MFYIQFLILQYLHEQYISHFPMLQIKQVIYLSNCKKKKVIVLKNMILKKKKRIIKNINCFASVTHHHHCKYF